MTRPARTRDSPTLALVALALHLDFSPGCAKRTPSGQNREILRQLALLSHASAWLLYTKDTLRIKSDDHPADYNTCAVRTAHPWGMPSPRLQESLPDTSAEHAQRIVEALGVRVRAEVEEPLLGAASERGAASEQGAVPA